MTLGEYTSLKEENSALQARLRRMQEELQSLMLIPASMVSASEEADNEDRDDVSLNIMHSEFALGQSHFSFGITCVSFPFTQAKTSLARDVCLLQSYATHLRSQLEERRAVELDIRRLNQALYNELLTANSAISDLENQLRFHSEIGKRDAKSLEVSLSTRTQRDKKKASGNYSVHFQFV